MYMITGDMGGVLYKHQKSEYKNIIEILKKQNGNLYKLP